MPISTRASDSTQFECEHCSFTFAPPQSAAQDEVRCPRCWRPVSVSSSSAPPLVFFKAVDSDTAAEFDALTSDTAIRSHDALDELVQSLESEQETPADDVEITDEELAALTTEDLEALGFGHLAPAVEEESPKPKPIVLPPRKQPEKSVKQDEPQPEPEHLTFSTRIKRTLTSYGVSLLLHALLLFLAALFVYQTQDYRWHGEIDGTYKNIGEGGGFELQAPIQFEAPLPVAQAERSNAVLAGSLGQGFGESPGKGGIGFFGTRARGKSFVFVVDISGSMTSVLPQLPDLRRQRNRRDEEQRPPVSRWDKARDELMQAIEAMSENQSFAVMLYNDNHHEFTRNGQPVGLMHATQRNKDDVRIWLDSVRAYGGTEPQLSIHEALKLKPEVVFFLTDGIIPAATRETAQRSNLRKTVIHTTCIGSLENSILQLIANDHGGRFRSVGVNGFDVGSEGVTLVCFVSSEPSSRIKFKRIEEDLERFESNLDEAAVLLRDDHSHSMLKLHNAVTDIPKFTLELQRLIKELNSGTRAGFDMRIGSGRLGINVPLDDLNLRFSDQSIDVAAAQTMPIRELLKTSVSDENMADSQAINAIYFFGDLDAKRELLSALEVFNLYNGSIIRLVDGEEFVKRRR